MRLYRSIGDRGKPAGKASLFRPVFDNINVFLLLSTRTLLHALAKTDHGQSSLLRAQRSRMGFVAKMLCGKPVDKTPVIYPE